MTDAPKPDGPQPENPQQSLSLPLDQKDLLRWRVLPVELAGLVGVTKQSVSRWIRDGKIAQPSPLDGRLDLQRALRDVLRNTDPGRLRSRVLRQAVEDVAGLRDNLARAEDRAETAEAALRDALDQVAHFARWADDSDRAEEIFKTLIIEQADRLRAAPTDEWPAILDGLLDDAILAADPSDEDDLADFIESTEGPRAIHDQKGNGGDAA